MSSFCFLVQYLWFLGSERMVASYMKLHVGEKIKVSVDSINSQGDGVARFGEERFVFLCLVHYLGKRWRGSLGS